MTKIFDIHDAARDHWAGLQAAREEGVLGVVLSRKLFMKLAHDAGVLSHESAGVLTINGIRFIRSNTVDTHVQDPQPEPDMESPWLLSDAELEALDEERNPSTKPLNQKQR